jgi:signal transduction histidine kinase
MNYSNTNRGTALRSIQLIRQIFLVSFCLLFAFTAWCQEDYYDVESLKQQLDTTTDLSERSLLFVYLSDAYRFSDKELAQNYAHLALAEAKRSKNDQALADSYFQLEQAYFFRDDYEQALLYIDSSIVLYRKINDLYNLGMALQVKGNILSFMGRYNEAYESLLVALSMYEEEGELDGANSTKLLLASVLDYIKEYDRAEALYKEAIDYFSSLSDDEYYYDDLSFGLTYYGTHLEIRERYREALVKYTEVGQLADLVSDPYGELIAKVNLGLVYAFLEQYDSSAFYCSQALDLSKIYEDLFEEEKCYKCLGITYQGLGKSSEAEQMFLKADQLADVMEVPQEQMDIKKKLADFYKQQGDYQKALTYHEAYKLYSDSTYNSTKSAQFSFLQTEYDIAVKERTNQLLQEELTYKTKQSALYLAVIVLALAFIIALYSIYVIQQKSKKQLEVLVSDRTKELQDSNERLQQANKELQEFTYITSHDLKEPIRNINSYAFLTERKIKDSKMNEAGDFLSKISKSAIQLNDLVNDVYNFVRLDELSLNKDIFMLSDLTDEIRTDLQKLDKEKNGRLRVSSIQLRMSKNLLKIILKNLIQNGWKYNEQKESMVNINCVETETTYEFEVSDNGIGIAPQFHEQVFQMFKRLHGRGDYAGSGLGLPICKKMVVKMGGDISITTPGIGEDGITVRFFIPK